MTESTIETNNKILTRLSTRCDLNNPEGVKLVLANLEWANNTKRNTSYILKGFYEFLKIPFEKPRYKREHKLPFIPTEKEIDTLISAGSPTTATRLQILKETGARTGELDKLEWTHIDFERKTIYITAEKGSNSRILPLSDKCLNMINRLQRYDKYVFRVKAYSFRKTFSGLRKRTVAKLSNPRLKKIHIHTFRHFKGTMEYHKTHSIYHVKKVLGHKTITSTELYINLEDALFLCEVDDFICKATTDKDEAMKLIESGFQYTLTTTDGYMLFKKRK